MKTTGSGLPAAERRDWGIRVSGAFFASVIAAALGPFGTYEHISFFERLMYWGGLIFGLLFPAHIVRAAAFRFAPGPPLQRDLVAAAAVSILVGPVVWLFNRFFMAFDIATPFFLLQHIVIVLLVCLVPVSIRAYMRLHLGEMQAQSIANEVQRPVMTEAQAAFLRRLEPEKRGYVLRVSADDHQVAVWTDQGGSKLRLRFGDALEELSDFDGTRIHRSHWVAYDTIEAVVPDGRRHVVLLSCGTQLPVSQNGLKALQEAGVEVQERTA